MMRLVIQRFLKGIQLGLFSGAHVQAGPPKPPAGFTPIPGSKKGGYHRKTATGWDYWYPDHGLSKPTIDDEEAVKALEHTPPSALVHFVSPTGERSERGDYALEDERSAHPYVLTTKDEPRMGIGTVIHFASQSTEEVPWGKGSLTIVGREEEPTKYGGHTTRLTVRRDDGSEFKATFYELLEQVNRLHGLHTGPRGEILLAKLRRKVAALHREIEAERGRVLANPTAERVLAIQEKAKAIKDITGSDYRFNENHWAQLLDIDRTMPRTWDGVRQEIKSLTDRLEWAFPGATWEDALQTRDRLADLYLAPDIQRRLARLLFLRWAVQDYRMNRAYEQKPPKSDPWANTEMVRTVTVGEMEFGEPGLDGEYTDAQIEAAIHAYLKDRDKKKAPMARLRLSVFVPSRYGTAHVSYWGQAEDSAEKAKKNRAMLRAFERYADSHGLMFLTSGRYQEKDLALYTLPHGESPTNHAATALRELAAQQGLEARPEVYRDQGTEPIRVQTVAERVRTQTLPKYRDVDPAVRERLAAAMAHDPVIVADVPTGERAPASWDPSHLEDVWKPVMAPVSVLAALATNGAKARVDAHRAAHQARLARLRERLAVVEARNPDPTPHLENAVRTFAVSRGIDPDLAWRGVQAVDADNVALARQAKTDRGTYSYKGLWHLGWDSWAKFYPEKVERWHRKYRGEALDEGEEAALEAHRSEFVNAFRGHVSDHLLAGIKAAIGHETDEAAAVAAVHEPGERKVYKREEKAEDPQAERATPYDIQEDLGGLRRLLGWVSKDVIPHVDIGIFKIADGRAYCTRDNGIALAHAPKKRTPLGDDTLHHEYGHAIEHDHPEIGEFACTLRDERGKNSPREKLADLHGDRSGYHDWEETYKDEWDQEYTGKWYGHLSGTEVLSMGTEALLEDPLNLWRGDREHFLFTVGALSGLLSTKKKSVHPSQNPKQVKP